MQKHRVLILGGIFIALVAMVLSSFGTSAHAASLVYGPFAGSSPDGGSCHNYWAQDSYGRQFTVNPAPENPSPEHPAIVREDFLNATFVTFKGVSPGACDVVFNGGIGNGSTVSASVNGNFTGYEVFVVTSGHLNPSGCDVTGVNCDQGNVHNSVAAAYFISALYGNGVGIESTAVRDYSFVYTACTDGLGQWQDAQKINGVETFTGDITGNGEDCPTPTPVPPTPTPVPPTPTPVVTPVPPGIPTLPNTGSDPRV
jgi:hypothetical protein